MHAGIQHTLIQRLACTETYTQMYAFTHARPHIHVCTHYTHYTHACTHKHMFLILSYKHSWLPIFLHLRHLFHPTLPPSTSPCPSLHWSQLCRWRPFRRFECLPQYPPELLLRSLVPLQIRVCCEQTPQGGILVLR